MSIEDWEGTSLIIGAGGIGNQLSERLKLISPKLDVILCGRKLSSKEGINLDLEMDAMGAVHLSLRFSIPFKFL